MNVKSISRTVGLILLITGIFQLFPLLIAVIDHEPRNILAYIESLCLILLVGSALLLFSRGGNRMFSAQEGFAATGLSWIFMSAFGALPFFLSGQIPSYVDAFFEMVSGFTTTGASILTDVEPALALQPFLAQLQPLARRYGRARVPLGSRTRRAQKRRHRHLPHACGKPRTERR